MTAFVRDRARLTPERADLTSVVGDVMDRDSGAVFVGQDAVICALGTMPESKQDRTRRQRGVRVCSVGTKNILAAMIRHQIRRIVLESSACVGSNRRRGRFGAGHVVHFVLRDVMDDKELQEAPVRNSTLEWTIIRPVKLTNGPLTSRVRHGENLEWGFSSKVSRADVAAFMLDAMVQADTIRRELTVRT